MTDKPTDGEILKALEYCSQQGSMSECERCKIKRGCRFELIKLALDLINRLQAEIERLQQYYDDMQSAIYEFREDHAKVKFFKKEIKAEAYKEFAERLDKEFSSVGICNYGWVRHKTRKVLKELVGDNNDL